MINILFSSVTLKEKDVVNTLATINFFYHINYSAFSLTSLISVPSKKNDKVEN